jgi:hypothetical protein
MCFFRTHEYEISRGTVLTLSLFSFGEAIFDAYNERPCFFHRV